MDIRSCRLIIEKNRINKYNKNKKNEKKSYSWLGETKEERPCVGTYEPDKTMTIFYDVNKNKKYGNNVFNSTEYSNRNGIYLFQKNIPLGPGYYYKDKFIQSKQISAAFNSTEDRFYRGGKNNTKDLYKIPKKSLSVLVKRNSSKNEYGNVNNGLFMGLEEKVEKEKKVLAIGNNINSQTPFNVGPGTYNYLSDVYPWIKYSFNVKFI